MKGSSYSLLRIIRTTPHQNVGGCLNLKHYKQMMKSLFLIKCFPNLCCYEGAHSLAE
jgi:hypothetical protein